ncbi:hypothetical protein PIB30_075354, partial [Stylosanthes scabra]|nr:hypothetical protein [Stylosanthes scabra]
MFVYISLVVERNRASGGAYGRDGKLVLMDDGAIEKMEGERRWVERREAGKMVEG